jgi:hypothetical protein
VDTVDARIGDDDVTPSVAMDTVAAVAEAA